MCDITSLDHDISPLKVNLIYSEKQTFNDCIISDCTICVILKLSGFKLGIYLGAENK